MAWRIKTEPTALPVIVSETRDHCDYGSSDRDSYFSQLIKAAMKTVERWEWRSLITQTLEVRLDAFPSGDDDVIYVPRPRLISVTSVKYVDTDGTTQTLSASLYSSDVYTEPGRIKPAYGQVWPTTRSATMNAVTIEVQAGYGASHSHIPEDTKQLIYILVKHFWDNPAAVTDVQVRDLPMGVDALLRPCHDAKVLEFV